MGNYQIMQGRAESEDGESWEAGKSLKRQSWVVRSPQPKSTETGPLRSNQGSSGGGGCPLCREAQTVQTQTGNQLETVALPISLKHEAGSA